MNTQKLITKLDFLGVEHDEIITILNDSRLTPSQSKGLEKRLSNIKVKIGKVENFLYQYCENKH